MMPEPLTLVCPSAGPRLRDVIETALCDLPVRNAQGDLRGARILFALDAGSAGMDEPTLRLLRRLRSEPGCLEGSVCGFVVDGETELYTKALAQDLALAANLAGAALPGKPLVEGTGSLYNQHILAARRGMSWKETYRARTRELGERLLAFSPKRVGRPKLLVLHASESGRSSTLWMGRELSRRLSGCCSIAEISLRNGTIHDCRGCSYSACLHFARSGIVKRSLLCIEADKTAVGNAVIQYGANSIRRGKFGITSKAQTGCTRKQIHFAIAQSENCSIGIRDHFYGKFVHIRLFSPIIGIADESIRGSVTVPGIHIGASPHCLGQQFFFSCQILIKRIGRYDSHWVAHGEVVQNTIIRSGKMNCHGMFVHHFNRLRECSNLTKGCNICSQIGECRL